jgi:aspartate carbamoyltransferase catalytic subunit
MLKGRHVISLADFDREELYGILDTADQWEIRIPIY